MTIDRDDDIEDQIEENEVDDLDSILNEKFEELQTEKLEDEGGPAKPVEETPEEKITDQKDEVEQQTAEKSTATEPPISWPAADKAKWNSIPPDMQQIIASREKERDKFLTQKSNEYTQSLAQYKDTDHAWQPVEQFLKDKNVSKPQALKELVGYYQSFLKDPVQYALTILQSNGTDIRQLAATGHNPDKAALHQYGEELRSVREELNSLKQEREKAEETQLSQELESFKNSAGHEHFEAVRNTMSHLILAGEADSLQVAYDKAVWANPNTRALEQKKLEADRAKNSTLIARKAKAAAGPKLSTKEFSQGKNTLAENEDEVLSEAYDRILSA